MCCFNTPFTVALLCMWSNPYADEEDDWTSGQILSFPFLILCFPILFIIDVITFPFHLINVISKRCFGLNPSATYWYEWCLCGWRERSSGNDYYKYDIIE